MAKDNKDNLEIPELDTEELLKEYREKAKLRLEIKKFNRKSQELGFQRKKSNRWSESAWFKIITSGAVFSLLGVILGLVGSMYLSRVDRKKDLHKTFLEHYDLLYGSDEKCSYFIHTTDTVFRGEPELVDIFEKWLKIDLIPKEYEKCRDTIDRTNFAQKMNQDLSESTTKEAKKRAEEIKNQQEIEAAIQHLVGQLTTDTRKEARQALIELSKDSSKKQKVVDALIKGILTPKNKDESQNKDEYRKNLSVAYILGKITNWSSKATNCQKKKVCDLKQSQYFESGSNPDYYFIKRVNEATKGLNCPN